MDTKQKSSTYKEEEEALYCQLPTLTTKHICIQSSGYVPSNDLVICLDIYDKIGSNLVEIEHFISDI